MTNDNDDDCDTTYDMSYEKLVQLWFARHMKGIGWLGCMVLATMHPPRPNCAAYSIYIYKLYSVFLCLSIMHWFGRCATLNFVVYMLQLQLLVVDNQ